MKRDFTQQQLEEFREMIRQMQDEPWQWMDPIMDGFLAIKHLLQKLGILEKTKDLDAYHREVLDRENASEAAITRIFEEVSSVDTQAASGSEMGIGYCVETLEEYIRSVHELTEIAVGACAASASGQSVGDHFEQSMMNLRLRMVNTALKAKLEAIRFNADTFGFLSDSYKDAVVRDYETNNPGQVEMINKVLSDPDLTDAEKRDIKFLIYTSPEPYRSIYLQHISKYKVIVYTPSKNEGSYYRPSTGEIYLKDGDRTFRFNPRGPYNTFFHESGHAIDDYEKGRGDMTESFRYNGMTLNECLTADVRNYVEDYMKETYPELTEAQREKLLRSLNLTDDASYQYGGSDKGLSKVLQNYRKEIVAHMNSDLDGDVNECPSDVYGGVTNNAIIGDWGHRKDATDKNYTYWYNGSKPTGHQESELWAEFFAAKMTRDEAALKSIKSHFPQAYKAMEAMAQEMLNNDNDTTGGVPGAGSIGSR